MSEETYNKKLQDLQKYIPFMENMIAQLKDPKGKPREAQLNKMESLYNMITDRNKKWKYETLLKCEEVIIKLQSKVKANRPIFPSEKKEQHYMNPERPDIITNTVNDIMNALKFNNARVKLNCEMSTPKSPSPVRDVICHSPKIIPFEATNEPTRKSTNIVDPNELSVTWDTDKQDRYVNERPDIYNSAARSLGVVPSARGSIFDRLGPVVPEVTEKPLLTDADLEMLRAGDDFAIICQNEQIKSPPNQEKSLSDINLKVTPRIMPVPASKPKIAASEATIKEEKPVKSTHKDDKNKHKEIKQSKSPKTEKLTGADMFGSCLSSIDNMILEDTKKKEKKKDERRHSTEHKKDKHHHESKHHHKHKDKVKEKHKNKDGSKKEDPRLKNEKDKSREVKDTVVEKLLGKPDIAETVKEEVAQVPVLKEQPADKPKRLADKYNPKPRKHVEIEPPDRIPNIPNEVPNLESRDPRRRTGGILSTPTSILGNPPFPQPMLPNLAAIAINNAIGIHPNIPALAPLLSMAVQQPVISPQPIPLMNLNVPHPSFQSPTWLGDNQEFPRTPGNPIFEPPAPKHFEQRRPGFHQDNTERIPTDPRRQPKFSPPPSISPVHTPQFANHFIQNIFGTPLNNLQPLRSDLNYIPPLQRNAFEPPLSNFQSRFEPPLPANRFDSAMPPNHNSKNTMPRKGFSPFEPLESAKDQFSSDGFRRNDNHPASFRGTYGQYRNSDRYGRKPQRDMAKPGLRDENKPKTSKKEENKKDEEWRTKEELEVAAKELSHTKYDEIYSKLDSEKETFTSPLECLYSNPKTSVKSIQSFKIPKKPKPEPPPPPPPIEEVKVKELKVEKPEEVVKDTNSNKKIEDKLEIIKKEVDGEVVDEIKMPLVSADSEEDDLPLWKRMSRRVKTMTKKKIIEDSEEEECPEEVEPKEEEESSRPKRVTRQSAIRANKLITRQKLPAKGKRKVQKPKLKVQKADSIQEPIAETAPAEEIKEPVVAQEQETKDLPDIKSETELIDIKEKEENPDIDNKAELEAIDGDKPVELTTEDVNAVKEDTVEKENQEPDQVQKAKNELLSEAKKKNLNLNDQGAEVLQFILMNYKKIKKIFKSDSSSEDEEREKRKKKKKRGKSASDDETESKEKQKHREKVSSEDEKEEKDKCRKRESEAEDNDKAMNSLSQDSVDENDQNKIKEIGKDSDKNAEIKEIAAVEKGNSEEIIEAKEPIDSDVDVGVEEMSVETKDEQESTLIQAPAKQAPKKKINTRRKKIVITKVPGRLTRNKTLISPVKKARRSELDKLHDDIKEMLMGGEVLTSTGKRACTMPRDDSEDSRREDSTTEDQSTTSLDQPSLVMPANSAHLRVLLEKTDIDKLLLKDIVVKEETPDPPEEDVINTIPPPVLEKMVVFPAQKVVKKKILRKKKYKWASGIIKRKNKRKISASEDKAEESEATVSSSTTANTDETSTLYKLHDKNYYTTTVRSYCRLCTFRGKYIIQHYKSLHSFSEVLISRMEPKVTEHLINEAKDKNYDLIVLRDLPGLKRKRYGYKCPFMCPIGTTIDYFENYYDHITSHTGEYRYFCPFCSFSTSNPRNLRGHMVPQHNSNLEHHGKPTGYIPPASKYLFGYVCRECHYVQTRKDHLEKHVKDYHDNNAEIIKVNLSLICMEQDEAEARMPALAGSTTLQCRSDHVHESIENVVNGAGSIKSPEPVFVKDLNIFELMSQLEVDEPPPVLVKMEPLEPELDMDTLIPEISIEELPIRKDPDLTVFMCKSDFPVEDEQTIEEKRLKKMKEIHENVRPSRTSIADRLQSKLETTAQQEESQPTSTPVPPPTSIVITAVRPPPLILLDRSKKSLDPIPKSVVPTEVMMGPKKIAPISNIINRLQDKLLPPPSSSKLPVIEQEDIASATSSLHIGPITVTFHKDNDILYSCLIPSCVFKTTNAQIFETHCRTTHKDYVYNQTKCDFCQIKIDHEDDFVSMYDIYQHISTCHSDFLRGINIQLEFDDAIGSELEDMRDNTTPSENDLPQELPSPNLEVDPEFGKKYPFVIANVQSAVKPKTPVPLEKQMEFVLPHKVPNLISQASNDSGPKFPFVITSVTSLAKKPPLFKVTQPQLSSPIPSTLHNIAPGSSPAVTNSSIVGVSLMPSVSGAISPISSLSLVPALAGCTTTVNNVSFANSPMGNVTLVPAIATLSPISTMSTTSMTSIKTSPSMTPYTVASVQPTPAVLPLILNPLAPENDKSNKVQLPVISYVQSLAPARKDSIRPVPLKQLTASSSSKTTASSSSKPIASSSNKRGALSVVSVVSNDGKMLTLKDVPMTMSEKIQLRKSKMARQALLARDVICHFYKCPQFSCVFATDKPQELLAHLPQHTELTDSYVSCLYCDYKTNYKLYLVHLEVHHGKCEYACGRCFYRATNSSFVMAHSSMRHEGHPVVVKTPRENMPARLTQPNLIPIRHILKPYVCGEPGCTLKTVFTSVYFAHLSKVHNAMTKATCGICKLKSAYSSIHWAVHNVHYFHCRYCPMGSRSMKEIVNHQAMMHFKHDYCIIFRKFVPNTNFPERTALSYQVEDADTYDRLFLLYGGADETDCMGDDVIHLDNLDVQTTSAVDIPSAIQSSQPNRNTQSSPTVQIVSSAQTFQNDETVEGNEQQDQDDSMLWDDMVVDENEKGSPSDKNVTDIPSSFENVTVTNSSQDVQQDEPEIPLINADLDEAVTDPLSLDVRDASGVFSDGDSNDERDGDVDAAHYNDNINKYNEEYSGAMLYKCICNMRFEDKMEYKAHVVACQGDKIYKCAHCGIVRKSVRTLLTHMNEHGKKRFKCSLCQYKHFSKRFVRDHMNVTHNVSEVMILPATVTKKIDYTTDDFVLRPKLSPVKRLGVIGAVVEPPEATKTVFSPEEINQLPRQPIYQTVVFCAVCNYATKVKSNMVRHLQAHQNEQAVPETAPVNPVPCLEKSEKMFDKMVNLALSSHSSGKMGGAPKAEKAEEIQVPTHVPINKRYVCGSEGCNYLCPEEGMLRRHLSTFHSQELVHTCLHCNTKIFEDKIINVEAILKHLKLHDNHLYGCAHCKFIHNLRHKVERHISEKHGDKGTSLVIYREVGKEAESEVVPFAEKEEINPWKCGMCKSKFPTIEKVKAHTNVKHNVNAKHKCARCEYGSEDVASFGKHFEINHSGQNIDVIVTYYKKEEMLPQKPNVDPEFNTTPLWQRNKSVKHIRGILLEDGNNKIPKTPSGKKAKTLKAKKLENALTEGKGALEPGKKDAPIILNSFMSIGIPADIKKLTPKRRKSKANTKAAAASAAASLPVPIPAPVIESKKRDAKKADHDVILVNNSDEDNSQVLDVTSVIDTTKSKKSYIEMSNDVEPNNTGAEVVDLENYTTDVEKPTKSNSNQKPKILTVAYYKVGPSDTSKKKRKAADSTSKTSGQNSNVVDTAGDKQSQISGNIEMVILESNNKEPKNNVTIEISDSPTKVNTVKKRKVAKKVKKAKAVLQNCEINFVDSSAEDSDVIEVPNDLDPLSENGSTKVAEITIPDDEVLGDDVVSSTSDLASSLKNIKVVSVCSLKDFEAGSVIEESTAKDDLIIEDENDESPTKKLKLDISVEEIDTMSKTELLNGNFVGTYGPYGSPWNGKYKCPLCEKYLSISTKEFMAHIYEELHYGVYKCTACDYRDTAQETIVKHYKESHKEVIDAKDSYTTTPDQSILGWVAKLIVFQSRILTLDKEESSEVHWYCNFCDYKCTGLSDMRKHQFRHWALKPYTCTICKYESIQSPVMDRHVKRSHPGQSVKITESMIGDGVIIKRIRFNGRVEDVTEVFETFEKDGENDVTHDDLKDALLCCCYCTVRGNLDKLRKHIETDHPNSEVNVYRYRCNHCGSTFLSPRTLDQHFISCHSGMKRSYSEISDQRKRYHCPECPVSDDRLTTMKEHLRSHYKLIKCIHCDLQVVYWKTMRSHMQIEHPDHNFEFLYLLDLEKSYENAISTITEVTLPNLKRKRTEDDIQLLDDSSSFTVDEDVRKLEEETVGKPKQVAKKSTGYHRKLKEPESHYRRRPDARNFSKIITTVDFMGASLTMNIVKLSEMLNISPIVLVEDCGKDL